MSLRAFVARSGWNKTPISAQEWYEAASTLPELELHAGPRGEPVRAMLRGSRRRSVVLLQGYLCGHHVDGRLIAVLFVLADRLGAQVFSERRNIYVDVADWQQRVGRHAGRGQGQRQSAAAARDAEGFEMRSSRTHGGASWWPFVVGAMLTGLLAVWALG